MLNRKINEALGTALLGVPSVALLSANFFFMYRSFFISVIPYPAFTLQDHFDKAVDFLTPIFVLGAIVVAASVLVPRMVMTVAPVEPDENAHFIHPVIAKWFLVVGTLVSAAVFFFLPASEFGFAVVAFTTGLAPLYLSFVYRVFSPNPHPGQNANYFWMALSGLLYVATIFALVMMTVEAQVSKATIRYLKDQKLVLLDSSSSGWLVIDDGEYKIIRQDGSLVAAGQPIKTESTSAACRMFSGFFCATTKNYIEIAKRTSDDGQDLR